MSSFPQHFFCEFFFPFRDRREKFFGMGDAVICEKLTCGKEAGRDSQLRVSEALLRVLLKKSPEICLSPLRVRGASGGIRYFF